MGTYLCCLPSVLILCPNKITVVNHPKQLLQPFAQTNHLLHSYFISSIQLQTYLLVCFKFCKRLLLCSLTRLCHCYAVLFSFLFFFLFFFGFLNINFGYWNLSIVLNCLQTLLTITIKKLKIRNWKTQSWQQNRLASEFQAKG